MVMIIKDKEVLVGSLSQSFGAITEKTPSPIRDELNLDWIITIYSLRRVEKWKHF